MLWMMGMGNPDPVCFGLWDQAIQYKSALDVGNRSAVSGGITAETIIDKGTTTRIKLTHLPKLVAALNLCVGECDDGGAMNDI